MKKAWNIILIILSVINIALFVFWLSLIKLEWNVYSINDYILNNISLQISILEAIIATLGIVLAILGFWSYQNIKESAAKKAEDVASQKVQEYLNTVSTSNPVLPTEQTNHQNDTMTVDRNLQDEEEDN